MVTLREKKMQRTREAIVAAGMDLFAQRGFDDVTVADIATRADVAPRTFHRYFPDKAELLFASDALLRDNLQHTLEASPSDAGILSYVLDVVAAACRPLEGLRAELVVREHLLEQVTTLRGRDLVKQHSLEQMIAEHVAARLGTTVSDDVRPRWWAGLAFTTFRAGYQVWLQHGGTLSEHVQAAAGLLTSAVASNPAAR